MRSTYQIAEDHYHSFGGDPDNKAPTALRLFYQQIHGLTYTPTGEDYDYVHGTMDAMKVDVLGLSETNSPWNNHHLTNAYTQAISKYTKLNKTSFSSPTFSIDPIPPTVTHQMGGTATTTYGSWITRLQKSQIGDPTGLGRWSGTIIGGRKSKSLAIITGYRVCEQSRNDAGEGTVMAREWDYLLDKGVAKPNPRQSFLDDLKRQITQLQEQGREILLMLDANQMLQNDNKLTTFGQMAHDCDLHDLHSTAPARTTCHSSTRGRIDYILGSPAVVAAILQSGTLSYAEGLTSDHRGLFVDIDFPKLLQLDTINQILPPAGRLLRSGNPEAQEQYTTTVKDYMQHHNMFDRLDDLANKSKRISRPRLRRLLNQLDQDLGRAMKAGEASLRNPPKKYQYSPTLRKLGLLHQYWRTRYQDFHNERSSERTYQTIADALNTIDSTIIYSIVTLCLHSTSSGKNLTPQQKI